MRTISFAEAMNEALLEEMRRDPSVFILGLGLHMSSKPPSMTAGLLEEFGEQRVRSIPISPTSSSAPWTRSSARRESGATRTAPRAG